MVLDGMITNMFTDIGFLLAIIFGMSLVTIYIRPYLNYNKYLYAFKYGLLKKASDKENIDLELLVKKTSSEKIEDIIDNKIKEALEVKD